MFSIQQRYLLFLGDASDDLAAKTARGILDWRPDFCVGQIRLPECNADLGILDLSIEEAIENGAKTLVVGVANRGGVIGNSWMSVLRKALESGLDLAAGLHNKLLDIPELAELAERHGRTISDVRHPNGTQPIGNGKKRSGKRLVPVGTDCSCGKMYTALSVEKELKTRNIPATFRATGQTGILISGEGVSVDAVTADFISGAVEKLAPANSDDHWDVIEGQGSLFHPSFAGVSTGLLHGAQADALVLCHEPTRTHMRGVPTYPIPNISDCMELSLKVARLTNKEARFVGLSINTSKLSEDEALKYLQSLEAEFGLPAVDPYRFGVGKIVDQIDD
jgi:uncharacterized NAD-dependent epimerase/dehydratase family protein